MSGGSYHYLCHKDFTEAVSAGEEIQRMADRLAALGYAEDAAKETMDIILEISQARVRIQSRIDRLRNVWMAVEWWDSCDTSEDGVKDALEEYRNPKS